MKSVLYRLKIIQNYVSQKKEIVITAVIEAEGNKKESYYTIKISYDKEDFYDYDFNFREFDVLPLKQKEQFDIFLKSLEENKEGPNKKEAFIKSSTKFVSKIEMEEENDDKIESEFYFSLILEACKSSNDENKLVNEIILLFKPEKIKDIKNLPEDLMPKLDVELEKLKIDEENENLSKAFYYLLLCFYFFFKKIKINKLLQKSDKILYSLSDKLEDFPEIFGSFSLNKQLISKLIQKSESFEQVLKFLFLAPKKERFVEVLLDNNQKINSLIQANKNSEQKIKQKILLSNYFEINIDKDINTIIKNVDVLNRIVDIEKCLMDCLDKSAKIGMNLNYDTLIAMKNIFNEKLGIHDGKNYNKILDCIHSNFLELIKLGKLKNIEVLNKLEEAQYEKEIELRKKAFNSLDDILKGIDINLLKEDKNKEKFFEKWRKIAKKIFGKNYEDKVISLIDRMEDFHLLNKFFDEKTYSVASNDIINKYLELIPTCNQKTFENIFELTVDLINKNYNYTVKILKGIEKLDLDININIYIYIKLIKANKGNRKKLDEYVENVIEREIEKRLSLEKKLELIKSIPAFLEYNLKIPNSLLSFGLKDLFNPNETDQYRFVKGLLNVVDVKSIKESKNTYLQKIKDSILKAINDFSELNFAFCDVILYFSENGEFEKGFKEKLGNVFKYDENFKMSEYFKKSEEKMNELKEKKKK